MILHKLTPSPEGREEEARREVYIDDSLAQLSKTSRQSHAGSVEKSLLLSSSLNLDERLPKHRRLQTMRDSQASNPQQLGAKETEEHLLVRAHRLSVKASGPQRLIKILLDTPDNLKSLDAIFPLWIPTYTQKACYDESHTKELLSQCTGYFKTNLDIKHMFLLDGTPLFNIDEIPMNQGYLVVSFRPFMRNRRLLFSLGGDLSYNEASTTLRDSTQGLSRTRASIDAKLYLDDREKRHLGGSVSKDVVTHRLKVFGSDILREDSFYQDLPKQTSKEVSKIFINNTYIAPSSKTAELIKDEEKILEPNQSKTLLNLKKQLRAINSVQEHLQTQSREHLKQETDFCFTTHREKLKKH